MHSQRQDCSTIYADYVHLNYLHLQGEPKAVSLQSRFPNSNAPPPPSSSARLPRVKDPARGGAKNNPAHPSPASPVLRSKRGILHFVAKG